MLCVPLVGRTVEPGTILVRRDTAQPYDEGDVALLGGFADQALIAIENARVFTELEQTNREVSEALEQQTAVAAVLQTISKSAFDLGAVLRLAIRSQAPEEIPTRMQSALRHVTPPHRPAVPKPYRIAPST